jgi:hypothetical protein
MGNSFAPQFEGRFVESQGAVALVGCFTMPLSTKVFLSFWFGFGLLLMLAATTMATLAVVAQRLVPELLAPLAGAVILAGGTLVVSTGKSMSRGDVEWLSDVIRRALDDPRPVR